MIWSVSVPLLMRNGLSRILGRKPAKKDSYVQVMKLLCGRGQGHIGPFLRALVDFKPA